MLWRLGSQNLGSKDMRSGFRGLVWGLGLRVGIILIASTLAQGD